MGRALNISGGALSAGKCSFTFLVYVCIDRVWSARGISTVQQGLTVQTGRNGRVSIRCTSFDDAVKTVGSYQALTGDDRVFVRETLSKVETLSLNARSYKLSRRLSCAFLHQSMEKTIDNELAPTTITKIQAQYISSGVQKHMLPMPGVFPTFPIRMRHVPFNFGGLGIHHPYHERGRQQLEA